MDQPALQGGGGGLGAVSHAELAENVINVTLDSRLADAQAGAYFFIRPFARQAARRWRRECAAIRRARS